MCSSSGKEGRRIFDSSRQFGQFYSSLRGICNLCTVLYNEMLLLKSLLVEDMEFARQENLFRSYTGNVSCDNGVATTSIWSMHVIH
jgi:hypothetical protein